MATLMFIVCNSIIVIFHKVAHTFKHNISCNHHLILPVAKEREIYTFNLFIGRNNYIKIKMAT